MNNTPLFEALQHHKALQRASFHTPGHKYNPEAFPQNLMQYDFTELPDTDSLYEAEGAILQSELHTATVLGTKRTVFSSGGCTLCIQAMLRLVSMKGKRKVILSRVLHRSAVNTLALLDLEPVWLVPKQDAGSGLPGRIQAEDVAAALADHPDAAAVYVTSPDYFGVLAPIEAIAEACKKYDVPLIVDNAHGAHLFFTSQKHPLELGAAMTADSPHKTLPVVTGGAWLNIADNRFIDQAKDAMALFGSTSPSYITMTTLDLCATWLETHGKEAYRKLEQTIAELKVYARSLGYTLPTGAVDPTRLSLGTGALQINGNDLAECFRENGVEPEHWDDENVVLIATPFNTEADFAKLKTAMAQGILLPKTTTIPHPPLPSLPEILCSPREAMFAPWEIVPLELAVGRIAADAACPCPPGVPVVMPGEKITKEITVFLQRYGFSTAKVIK